MPHFAAASESASVINNLKEIDKVLNTVSRVLEHTSLPWLPRETRLRVPKCTDLVVVGRNIDFKRNFFFFALSEGSFRLIAADDTGVCFNSAATQPVAEMVFTCIDWRNFVGIYDDFW